MGKITMEIECRHCGKKEIIEQDCFLKNSRLQLLAEFNKKNWQLPEEWITLEWWSRARIEDGYNGTENEYNQADFCSKDCLIKYWEYKKRRGAETR